MKTGIYFDSAYVLKCYLHEADADAVRELMRGAGSVWISALSIAEVACGFHRHFREGTLNATTSATVREQFLEDIRNDVWGLVPLTERILYRVELLTRGLPHNVYLRAGDAIHVASAMDAGFPEIWTNDRHLLAAAAHFGLKGRQVQAPSRS